MHRASRILPRQVGRGHCRHVVTVSCHPGTLPGRARKINVMKMLHGGTVIRLGQTQVTYDHDLKGPISLVEHNDGTLYVSKMTPLSEPASKIRESIKPENTSKEAKNDSVTFPAETTSAIGYTQPDAGSAAEKSSEKNNVEGEHRDDGPTIEGNGRGQ